MDPIKTGLLIAKARKEQGFTQKELAQRLQVTDKAVSKWERGLCLPDISLLLPLSQILGINLYELLKGEKISKDEMDEILKSTILYSSNEIKKQKSKYFKFSLLFAIVTVVISAVLVLSLAQGQEERGGITDRDTLYSITYYGTFHDPSEENLGSLEENLPLSWGRKELSVTGASALLRYNASFGKVVNAYDDERYVRCAMTNASVVLFTLIDEIDRVSIRFEDCEFTVNRTDVREVFSIRDFKALRSAEAWTKTVEKKQTSADFVNKAFRSLFTKKEIEGDTL